MDVDLRLVGPALSPDTEGNLNAVAPVVASGQAQIPMVGVMNAVIVG